MSRVIYIFLLVSISFGGFAQSNQQFNSFFQDFISALQITTPVLYTDKMPEFELGDRIKAIDKDKILGWNRNRIQEANRGRDSLVLTPEERRYIVQQVGQQNGKRWQEGNIQGAKLIPWDSIQVSFKTARNDWNKFHGNYGKEYYRFSAPMFLRGESLCLFYYEQYCGYDCANAEFSVFRRTKGRWELAFTFWGWVS